MAIIFINRFGHPDLSATSQMMSDLVFALAERGHPVRMIASRLTYEGATRLAPFERAGNVEITRIATTAFGRANLIGRSLDYLSFYLSIVWTLLRTVRRGDIVVVKTDPPMLSVVVAPVVRLKRAVLVNWLQDLFPEVAEGLAPKGVARWGFALLRALRNRSLKAAAVNVAIGDRMARRIADCGVPGERIRTIANFADGRIVRPVAHGDNPLRREWGLEDAFVVGYSGNLGRAHDYRTLLTAARLIEQAARPAVANLHGRLGDEAVARSRVVWVIIGGGNQMERMREEAEAAGLANMRFHPYQPRERLSESLSVPDLHLVTLRPDMEGLVVPSKYYGIAAVGRPAIFIGDFEGEIARLLLKIGAGTTVLPGEAERLAETVQRYAGDHDRTRREGAAARASFERAFDLPNAVRSWEVLLAGLKASGETRAQKRTGR